MCLQLGYSATLAQAFMLWYNEAKALLYFIFMPWLILQFLFYTN